MRVLYDTSVLVAALLVEHPNHDRAFPELESARRGEIQGYISTHTFAELYAVMTRLPKPLKVLPEEAQALIADLIEYLTPVSLLPEEYESVVARMVKFRLTGGGIFDALIAQAALKVEVDYLITLNPKDFTRLGEEIATIVKVPPE